VEHGEDPTDGHQCSPSIEQNCATPTSLTWCPSCQHDSEEHWHYLECDHAEHKKLFTHLKTNLTTIAVKYSLHPSMLTTFWLGLTAIQTDTLYPQIKADLPLALQPVFRSQSCLGWDQLYHRHISTTWEKAIDILHLSLPLSGHQIMVQMVHTVWEYILTTWCLHNQHLHQNNEAINCPDYQQAVQTMYKMGSQLPPSTREAVFRQPLQEMLDQPLAILWKWLEGSTLYIKQQLKAVKTRTKLNTPDICSFFQSQSVNDLHPP